MALSLARLHLRGYTLPTMKESFYGFQIVNCSNSILINFFEMENLKTFRYNQWIIIMNEFLKSPFLNHLILCYQLMFCKNSHVKKLFNNWMSFKHELAWVDKNLAFFFLNNNKRKERKCLVLLAAIINTLWSVLVSNFCGLLESCCCATNTIILF